MKCKVTFTYNPEPEEIDADDRSGLTEAAWDDLAARLMEAGAEDIEIRQKPSGKSEPDASGDDAPTWDELPAGPDNPERPGQEGGPSNG